MAGPKKKRRALGRGLEALLPEREKPARSKGPSTLPLALIDPNPEQPRKSFDPEALESLARSLEKRGLIQPVLVRPVAGGRYQIMAGERRWRAAQKAGLEEIPVVIRKAAEDEAFELSLIENLQREDLNPMEAAEAYHRLMDEHGNSQEQLAAAVGKSRPAVANTLRLLTLPEAVKKMVAKGTLSEGHARAILQAEGAGRQLQVAREAVRKGLSVRETERLARRRGKRGVTQRPTTSAEVRDLEDQLRRSLSARVVIKHMRSGKGSIRIHYGSLDDLDAILARIIGRRRR
ncbi:MAG: ParB/RepB/Spo0J family partition protein [Deltaproteobacteria bacterium]|nr:ParB/RepB/Spo0J family partition protein [Deltaproteobacteria bacterium]